MRVLDGLSEGHMISKAMFEAWVAADVIAPVELEVKVTGTEPVKLAGFFTIEREKLTCPRFGQASTSCTARASCIAPTWFWPRTAISTS